MSYKSLNLVLLALALALALGWLLTFYRLVPRSGNPTLAREPRATNSAAAQRDSEPGGMWRLGVKLEVPDLDIPAVQCAVFAEDPQNQLREKLRKTAWADRSVLWDLLFRSVTGDEVYLLGANPNVSMGLASNAPGGKKWLVTKIARKGETNYCWSIPFTTAPGQDVTIQLTTQNALRLEDVRIE